jgi:PilZ domain
VEHRWGRRKPVYQLVHIRTAGGLAAQGHITNVSISGAFITTPLSAHLLSIVQIAFVPTNGRTRGPSALIAQVVRRTAEGLGVEWCCEQAPDTVRGLGETASLREPAAEDSNTTSYSSALALLQ